MAGGMRVAVVDYDAGNTLSVTRALEKAGASVDLTPDPRRSCAPTRSSCRGGGLRGLHEEAQGQGMDAACAEVFRSGKPFLGVCVALQVFFDSSEESPGVEGLGLLPGSVTRFKAGDLKVPHMGWNELSVARPHPVLSGLDGEDFYFVHSYYPVPEEPSDLLGTSEYGTEFCAAAGRENLAAVQFHPEKSSRAGLRLYENFLGWARKL
ncbi:imidazole glycerol phosphate synthase subunit HisH [Rubrobacter marinus]|uniref:Imidazole glycerol phosphate synthase subunit HisH n=1 Tax=Rubrobacter marinus TaxID=2653852 RepID=A0A6G8PYI2_9ACTN|nr:imidazole glycerol phosphate synthase subunit HisH [Rubrobacter marinus]QIN79225.1 imidazole glycerol phosphate synthase subunit HisH [Rubrobacter marinus]